MGEINSEKVVAIGDDLENWMSLLPELLRNMPIINLAIPGSHDSGSYSLTRSSAMSPDAIPLVAQLAKVFGPLVKFFVYNWSVTQHISITDQLQSGIRYLDLRLATKPGTKTIYFVHGQYGMEVEKIFREVDAFLASHEDEVVVLDFQHFYSFTKDSHTLLINLLDNYFGNKMCPISRSVTHISLKWMKQKGFQIIAIYRDDAALGISTLWPSRSWPTPWPETTSISTMISFLESKLANRPLGAGFVTQCVLTPDNKFFIKNLFSTLEKKCGTPCNRAIIPWLQKQRAGAGGVNVVISDFIKMPDIPFCQTVVKLNEGLL